jgi:hypothetical protein
MPSNSDPLTALTTKITADINQAIEHGGADRRDAIAALHLVLARVTRETEQSAARRMPDIRANSADNDRQ